MATIGSLTTSLELQSAQFIRELGRSTQAMNRAAAGIQQQAGLMQRGFDGASRSVALLGRGLATLGVGIGVSALVSMTRSAITAGAALEDVAARTGVAVEQLQRLRHAATLTGSSADALDQGLERFTRNVGTAASGSGELARTFATMGVEIRDANGTIRDTESILLDFADATAALESPAQRAAAAQAAFGRSGIELTGILSAGRAGIEAHGAELGEWSIVTDDSAAALARADDAIERFSSKLGGIWTTTVGNAILLGEDFLDLLDRMGGGGSDSLRMAERQFMLSAEIADAAAAAAGATGDAKRIADARLATLRAEGQLLVDQISALQATEKAQLAARRAVPPTTAAFEDQAAALEETAKAATTMAAKAEELTGAQKRLAAAGAFLTKTSAQEQRFDQQAEATERSIAAMQDFARQQDRIGDEIGRQQQRDAERTADLAMEPMRAALADMQSTMAGFFESALSGSIATFSDMADAFRSIFIRGVANAMSTALFNPSMINALFAGTTQATAQPTGGAAGAAGFGSGFTGLGGSLAAFGIGTGIGLTTHQLAGGRDQTAGLIGSTAGAAVGAGIGTLIAPGIGTLIGAALGGAAGGGLASLFGGGDKRARFSGGGGLGQIGGGEIGRFLADVDQQLVNMLTARQEALVDAALRQSSVNVRAKDFDQNVQAFAASQRIGPAAQALGFNASAITGGGGSGRASAEQQIQNLQTALAVQDQIRRLIEPAFKVAGEDLTNQFEELAAQAQRFGVSMAGLSEAQARAEQDLRRAQDAQLAALLDPFEALRSGLEAFQTELQFAGANPAEQFALAQAEFARIAAAAEGGSIPAIEQLGAAGRLLIEAADRAGASPAAGQAIAEVRSTLSDVLGDVNAAQERASEGITDAIDRARRDEVDTLRELIDEVRALGRKLERRNI